MRAMSFAVRFVKRVTISVLISLIAVSAVRAQSQEPKPTHHAPPATPISRPAGPASDLPESGVSGAAWEGPNYEIRFEWNPDLWTVEQELIEPGYDGLQIGTSDSTLFVEAYDGFDGDAAACLTAAEQDIRGREDISEVVPLEGRGMPATGATQGSSRLFGVVASIADGETYRGVEYVECRPVVVGTSVVELTWQTAASSYNQELPLAETVMSSIEMPGSNDTLPLPAQPPIEPNTA